MMGSRASLYHCYIYLYWWEYKFNHCNVLLIILCGVSSIAYFLLHNHCAFVCRGSISTLKITCENIIFFSLYVTHFYSTLPQLLALVHYYIMSFKLAEKKYMYTSRKERKRKKLVHHHFENYSANLTPLFSCTHCNLICSKHFKSGFISKCTRKELQHILETLYVVWFLDS